MEFKDSVNELYVRKAARRIERLKKDSTISERNRELILEFVNKSITRDDVHVKRVLKMTIEMSNIARMLGKDLDKADNKDIEGLVKRIRENVEWSDWTKKDHLVFLKKYYRYAEGNCLRDPEKTEWIKFKMKRGRESANVFLTQEDAAKMIAAGQNSFEKAAIATLYDGGFRYGEWAGIQRKHIAFEDGCVKVTVAGKTGRRTLPLLICEPYLARWLEEMPEKLAESFVFSNRSSNALYWSQDGKCGPLSEFSLSRMIKRLAAKSGISGKKLHPHAIRHARLTYMANFLSASQLCDFAGWVQGSGQMQTYIHGSALEQRIKGNLGLNGKSQMAQDDLFRKTACARCGHENPGTAELCVNCGRATNERAAFEPHKQQLYGEVMQQAIREEVMRILKGMGREVIDTESSKTE